MVNNYFRTIISISSVLSDEEIDKYMDSLPENILETKINSLKRESLKRQRLTNYINLLNISEESFAGKKLTVSGGIVGIEGLHVSMTHSGDICALIVSNVPVGIDVEKIRQVKGFENPERICASEKEIDMLMPDQQPSLEQYIKLWTMKESVFKASGAKSFNPSKTDISMHLQDIKLRTIEHRNSSYVLSVYCPSCNWIRILERIF